MKKLLFIVFPLILFSCGIQSNKLMTEEQKAKVIDEIKPVIDQLFESNEKLNYEKWPEWWMNSNDFCFITNGYLFDYKGMTESIKETWKSMEGQKYDRRIEKFIVLNSVTAIYNMQGPAEGRLKTGDIIKVDPYAISVVFVKIEGLWKIINGHASFLLPATPQQTDAPTQPK